MCEYNKDCEFHLFESKTETSESPSEAAGYVCVDKKELTYDDWKNMIKQAEKNKDVEALRLILLDLLKLRYEVEI